MDGAVGAYFPVLPAPAEMVRLRGGGEIMPCEVGGVDAGGWVRAGESEG